MIVPALVMDAHRLDRYLALEDFASLSLYTLSSLSHCRTE